MKKTALLLFICLFTSTVFSQMNPVQNLVWIHFYDSPYNIISLTWEEPETPHDELIGYNIYRENELYAFQPEIIGLVCSPEFGYYEDCDFIGYNDGGPFMGYVAAVYKGGIESEYVAFEVFGIAINVKEPPAVVFRIYPNPVRDILFFEETIYEISIFDLIGKELRSFSKANSVDVSDLPKGSYIIHYTHSNGEISESRFLKK